MGEETKFCPHCITELSMEAVECFNCGTRFPEQPESNEPAGTTEGNEPAGEDELQNMGEGEPAGETTEGEQISAGGAVSKLKSIFSIGEKIEVKAEDAEDPQAVEVKTGEMSGEPQNSQEDKPVE